MLETLLMIFVSVHRRVVLDGSQDGQGFVALLWKAERRAVEDWVAQTSSLEHYQGEEQAMADCHGQDSGTVHRHTQLRARLQRGEEDMEYQNCCRWPQNVDVGHQLGFFRIDRYFRYHRNSAVHHHRRRGGSGVNNVVENASLAADVDVHRPKKATEGAAIHAE